VGFVGKQCLSAELAWAFSRMNPRLFRKFVIVCNTIAFSNLKRQKHEGPPQLVGLFV
jgi:hypothetical protein